MTSRLSRRFIGICILRDFVGVSDETGSTALAVAAAT
jgi:hypothetical protein